MNISVIKNCPNQIFQGQEDFCRPSLLVDWPFWSSPCNWHKNPMLGLMSQFHWFIVSLLNVEYNKRYQPWADADNMSNCVRAQKSRLWKVQEGVPRWGGQKEKVDYEPVVLEDPFSLISVVNYKAKKSILCRSPIRKKNLRWMLMSVLLSWSPCSSLSSSNRYIWWSKQGRHRLGSKCMEVQWWQGWWTEPGKLSVGHTKASS